MSRWVVRFGDTAASSTARCRESMTVEADDCVVGDSGTLEFYNDGAEEGSELLVHAVGAGRWASVERSS